MQLIKEYIIENKKILLIIILIILVLTGVTFYIDNKSKTKIYVSDDYVYTKESYEYSDSFVSELPYINVRSDDVNKINTELMDEYYKSIEFKEKMMKYDYYINDNILSLVVKLYYLDSPDSYPVISIYNVDIENGNLLSDDDILNIFDISNYDVTEIINDQLKDYYNYEIRKEYISNDCDYNCYLSNINALPLDNCSFYVNNNILYAYKALTLDRDFYYDVTSGFNLYNFNIKELNN